MPLNASLELSQLPACIHNSIDAKHRPFLLEHCHFKRKLIKYRILRNQSKRFDWLNAITRFNRRTGVHLSRFRCTLAPYKNRKKNCHLCSKYIQCVTNSIDCYKWLRPLRKGKLAIPPPFVSWFYSHLLPLYSGFIISSLLFTYLHFLFPGFVTSLPSSVLFVFCFEIGSY